MGFGGPQATFVPAQAKKAAQNQMCQHPGAGETGGRGDQREPGEGHRHSSPPRAQGSQQTGGKPPSGRGQGSDPATGWVCTENVKFLLSSAGRTWLLDSGEQSIPYPTQNEA